MHKLIRGIGVVGSIALLFASNAYSEDWPCWRGPQGDGASSEKNVPVRWGESENVTWKVPIPGIGHGSPIVSRGRVFLLAADIQKQDRLLVALDRASGRILWQRAVLNSPLEKKHHLNSYASSTPATDGELIYVSFLDAREMVVAAYDFDGNQRWLVRPGSFFSPHGYCSSPVLFKDKVIVNGDHDGDAYIVALDRASGKTLWKTDRENKTRSYCTPIIRDLSGRTQLLLSGSKCVASYDPNDGSRHWIIDGPTEQFVASLVTTRGLVFVTGGYPEHHILAIKPDGSGNVTDSHVVWHETAGASYVPSPITAGDYFLLVSDGGIGSCFDAVSGRRLWKERMEPHYSASLVSAGGLVYFLADNGTMTVVRPGNKLDVVAKNKVAEYCYASPAISEGQIFLRGEKSLYCIGHKAQSSAAARSR